MDLPTTAGAERGKGVSDEQKQPLDRRSNDQLLQQVLKGQDEIKDLLRDITRAFPKNEFGDPDYDGHRRAHQTMMKQAQDSEDNRRGAVSNVRNAVIIGGGTIGLSALWEYIKAHVK